MPCFDVTIQCPRCGRDQRVSIDGIKTPKILSYVAEVVMLAHYQTMHESLDVPLTQIRVGVVERA
jgi:hypothetical protein